MNFAPVGIKCPDHAGAGARARSGSPVRQARVRLGGLAAPATVVLVAINVAVYLMTVAQGDGLNRPGGKLFNDGALVGVLVSDGEWWRLVTAMFLHGSVLHLAFNMFALYWLGSIVEDALGSWRFVLVYFASGLAGSAGALLLSSPYAVTVGASGAIYGIMGALLVLEYLATGSFAGQALGLIVLNLMLTLAIPNISIGGHLGGLIGGIVATVALARTRHAAPRSLGASLGPALVIGVAVAAVVVAYIRVESYTL